MRRAAGTWIFEAAAYGKGQGQRQAQNAPGKGAARTEGTLSLRVGCGMHWEGLLFSGGHLALLTFFCLPTSLGTSFPSNHSFSNALLAPLPPFLKCGVPR